MLFLLPGTPSPLLFLPNSHSVFYDSSQASVSPGRPLRGSSPPACLGWFLPCSTPPSLRRPPCIVMVCLFPPDSPVGGGSLEGRDHAGSLLSPTLSLAHSGAQEMPLNQTKCRRKEFCSPLPGCTDYVIRSEIHLPNQL